MLLRNVITALIIIGIFAGSWALIIVNLNNSYPSDMQGQEQWNSSFNNLQNLNDKINQMNSSLRSQQISPLTAAYAMMTGAWNVFLITMNSIPLISGMTSAALSYIGIPIWITTSIISIIGAFIIFAIVAAVFWRRMV